jgi:probable HAF family extracellular repeat protein
MKSRAVVFFAATLCLILTLGAKVPAEETVRYSVTQFGHLTGGGGMNALALNNAGEVVGYAVLDLDFPSDYLPVHAVYWRNGVLTDLGTLNGGDRSVESMAFGINDSGLIVGGSGKTARRAGIYTAVRWDDSIVRALEPGARRDSVAYSVNAGGAIAGSSGGTAVFWQNGKRRSLGTFHSGRDRSSEAVSINDRGEVLGMAWELYGRRLPGGGSTVHSAGRHFRWAPGEGKEPVGESLFYGNVNRGAIGEDGTIVASNDRWGFAWKAGDYRSLPITPADIAPDGTIVGSLVGDSETRAAVFRDGELTDLNTVIPAGTPLLRRAVAINAVGQILVDGWSGSYLLTPLP